VSEVYQKSFEGSVKLLNLIKMDEILRYCIGIDVDKKEFKVNFRSLNSTGNQKVVGSRTFSNTAKGFAEFEFWIAKNRKHPDVHLILTMEATGVYHENLAWYFHDRGFNINIVLALKAKRYFQSLGLRSKNDQIDAQGLAMMGLQQELDLWKPGSVDLIRLRSLTRQYESVYKAKNSFRNQLEAVSHAAVSDPLVSKSLKSILKNLDSELEKLHKQICKTVKESEFLLAKWKLMAPIKGLGMLTFAVVVAETGGFALFSSIRQLTRYAGYDVVENQSGTRVGKTKISKKGNAHIRRAMFMPAFNVVRLKEGIFPALYERVYETTKLKMKGYVAVQRKLLCLMYTLWKREEVYNSPNKNEPSKKEEPEGPLSGRVAKATQNPQAKKGSSPAVLGATLDGPSGKVSPSGPLSGKTKILEKSYA
jgi:transposase